jgi:hypothetical protein
MRSAEQRVFLNSERRQKFRNSDRRGQWDLTGTGGSDIVSQFQFIQFGRTGATARLLRVRHFAGDVRQL